MDQGSIFTNISTTQTNRHVLHSGFQRLPVACNSLGKGALVPCESLDGQSQ